MLPKIMGSFSLAVAVMCALIALRSDGSKTMVYWCGVNVFTAGVWFATCKK